MAVVGDDFLDDGWANDGFQWGRWSWLWSGFARWWFRARGALSAANDDFFLLVVTWWRRRDFTLSADDPFLAVSGYELASAGLTACRWHAAFFPDIDLFSYYLATSGVAAWRW